MVQTKTHPQQQVDHLSEVAVFLRQADKLVKDGKYNEALEQIQNARKRNPKNLYALAYEERVRSIIASQSDADSNQAVPPSNELEKISSRAIAEAQRNADAENKKKQRLEQMKKDEEEARKREEQQRSAIRKKVEDLLSKAYEYHKRSEFKLALDEIARIHMIDPSNTEATKLEEQVRVDQDNTLRQAEAEKQKRQQEEEKRRKEYVDAELKRIQQEGEEKKRKAEEARKKIQDEKISKHLSSAKELCDEGRLDDALAELAFVIVLDPLNDEVIELEQRIREMEEEQQAKELERLELEKQEKAKGRQETQGKIRKQIETAQGLAVKHQYSEALRILSAAYVLDPLSQELHQAEEEIINARNEWMRLEEEKRQKEEDERQQQQEEEVRRLIQNAQKKADGSVGKSDKEKELERKQTIKGYLDSARQYLMEGKYENALGEIALAFVIDPFDEDINKLEEEIMKVQNERRTQMDDETYSDDQPSATDKPSGDLASHIKKVKSLIEAKKFDEALTEIALAKSITGESDELTDLENQVFKKRNGKKEHSPAPAESDETGDTSGQSDESNEIQKYLKKAKELAKNKEYARALDEITQAILIDPLNDDISKLEEDIRRLQEQ
jgi:hypothetical protein